MKIKDVHKFKLPCQYKIKGINWILNRTTKMLENVIIRRNSIYSCIRPNECRENIIISMTTYPARTEKVIWTIKSLLNQNVPVSRFILWLAEEQYPEGIVPQKIKQYEQYGLEIRFCDDLKSHKKYYYTMLENPNAIVITVDDDVIYPEDTIEKLLKMHENFPNAIICNQGRLIKIERGKFASYSSWRVSIPKTIVEPSALILPIGEGGVLYPCNALGTEGFNKEHIIQGAISADDIWLKFMTTINGKRAITSSRTQRAPSGVQVKNSYDKGLNEENVSRGKNDQVVRYLVEKYPRVLSILSEVENVKSEWE